MYAAYIGKKFLRLYNERYGTSHTAREFFDEIIFPRFFNAEKHFVNVSNSSFFQSVSEKELVGEMTKPLYQLQRLHKTIASKPPDGSSMVGCAAAGIDGTTSGQVSSSVVPPLAHEDVYASWIGTGFGIYAGDKLSFFIEEPEILWALYEGWEHYRKLLDQTPKQGLKGNQVETWNGLWLCHVCKRGYQLGELIHPETKDLNGVTMLQGKQWAEIVGALCRKLGQNDTVVQVYAFGSMNISVGFIPLRLQEIRNLRAVRDLLFGPLDFGPENDRWLDLLYETEFGFKRACERGQIGLVAMEPENLQKHIKDSNNQKLTDNRFHFFIYQIWITAMLNNTELYKLAEVTGTTLQQYEDAGEKAKTTRPNAVKSLWEATGKKDYLNCLTEIIKDDGTTAEVLEKVVDNIWHLPTDKFPLFAALIRFQYFRQKAVVKN